MSRRFIKQERGRTFSNHSNIPSTSHTHEGSSQPTVNVSPCLTENVNEPDRFCDIQQNGKESAGLSRQESLDVPDVKPSTSVKGESIESSGSERSPETVRKEYKELWQLRAAFHEEELEKEREERLQQEEQQSEPELDAVTTLSSSREKFDMQPDQPTESASRKDYSIDVKSESIFRQFAGPTGCIGGLASGGKVASTHPSIEEEDEDEEEEAIFV